MTTFAPPEDPEGSSPLARGKHAFHATRGQSRRLIPARAGKTMWRLVAAAETRAHPRSRGENEPMMRRVPISVGSSPLARGKPAHRPVPAEDLGLIPARAGKTVGASRARRSARAHPRSRGENSGSFCVQLKTPGSSPLARGKRQHPKNRAWSGGLIPARAGKTRCVIHRVHLRAAHPRSRGENSYTAHRPIFAAWLIPARAGKTSERRGKGNEPWAHPRSRGENEAGAAVAHYTRGSSPLARGKRPRGDRRRRREGLIPARAGKTPTRSRLWPKPGAHPRSRGENARWNTCTWLGVGSSPLARGKPSTQSGPTWRRGLIPARAGKTVRRRRTARLRRAHPRSRGENLALTEADDARVGSSPLARGKRVGHDTARAADGLIPARAGKTGIAPSRNGAGAAHPRSRGENAKSHTGLAASRGSSPLARGKLNRRDWTRIRFRLIPARAGKTKQRWGWTRSLAAHPRSRGENEERLVASPRLTGSSPLARGKHASTRA